MDIDLSEPALKLLIWLSDNPGRRVLTQWGSDPQKIRVNGDLLPEGIAAEHRELSAEGLLRTDGAGGKWKLSPKGILLAGVRSGRLPNGPRPGKSRKQHARRAECYGGKQKCVAARSNGKPCRRWAQRGSPYCASHKDGSPRRKWRCAATKRGGKPCQGWAQRGSPYCSSHPNGSPEPKKRKPRAQPERLPDKLSPSAKQNRRSPGRLMKIEIPESCLKTEPSHKLHKLPPIPVDPDEEKVALCERHGARLCSQPACLAAEEAAEYDRLAGQRLIAARPLVY